MIVIVVLSFGQDVSPRRHDRDVTAVMLMLGSSSGFPEDFSGILSSGGCVTSECDRAFTPEFSMFWVGFAAQLIVGFLFMAESARPRSSNSLAVFSDSGKPLARELTPTVSYWKVSLPHLVMWLSTQRTPKAL